MPIRESQLKFLSRCIDQIVLWARETLDSTADEICQWLRSPRLKETDHRPLKVPQEPTTIKRYVGYWKQFTFFAFRTGLFDEGRSDEFCGIRFTTEQKSLITEISVMLMDYRDDDDDSSESDDFDYSCDEDDGLTEFEDDDDDEEIDLDENDDSDGDGQGNRNMLGLDKVVSRHRRRRDNDVEKSAQDNSLLILISEKLFQFYIAVIIQRFSNGEDLHSPLVYFSAVLGIDVNRGRFREPYNYTSFLAALIWMYRLLILEYALPMREYKSLNWPSRSTYEDYGWRFEGIRRMHLVQGCYCPVSYLVSLLAYGKTLTKVHGRPGQIAWDDDGQGLQIKHIQLRLCDLHKFAHSLIQSLEGVMRNELFFRVQPPTIVLRNLKNVMVNDDPGFSIVNQVTNGLQDGHRHMLGLMMESVQEDVRLLDTEGKWDLPKCRTYLASNKRFLQLLMLGNTASR